MPVAISWDLLIVVFTGVVVVYSFIIGRHESMKLTVCCYLAFIATEASGMVLARASKDSAALLGSLGIVSTPGEITIAKLVIFSALLILLILRSGITIDYGEQPGTIWQLLLTVVFGATSAALLLSSLLVIISGTPVFSGTLAASPAIAPLLSQSLLLQILAQNQELFFALPALLLLAAGFLFNG